MTRLMTIAMALVLVLSTSTSVEAASWKVGVAEVDITPEEHLWMAGYASRNHPAEDAIHPLWAKGLAFEDAQGNKAVLVVADAIAITRAIAESAAERICTATGIPREGVLFNCSHTHSGPVIQGVTITYNHLAPEHRTAFAQYARHFEDKLVHVACRAAELMRPANLAFGQGTAGFAVNRRLPRDGKFVMSANLDGPVDHTVPLLRVTDENDRLVAVLFGYACHNTTLQGYQYSGDYAGFSQIALEELHPGATALFMIGCGGDANPHPRGTEELAEQHGRALAGTVETVLGQGLAPVEGALRAAMARVDLPLVNPPSKEELLARRGQGNIYQQRLTEHLLAQLEAEGSLPRSLSCPLQVIRFGDGLTLVGLSGEAVADYALRLRKELPSTPLWIAGYCNDVFAYLPSERVLAEGGYEGGDSMMYFGIHGPFKPGVEDLVINTVKRLLAQCEEAAGDTAR